MAQKLETRIQDSLPLKILLTLAFAAAYVVSEPTLGSTYFLHFTYRMQTLVIYANYAVLAVVYLLTVLQLVSMYRAKEKPDTGMLLPYIAVYIGYLVATLANPETGSMARWSDSFFYSMIPLLIAFLFCTTDGGKRYFLSTVSTIYLILAILNIIFYFFPQLYIGEGKDWREEFFLGFENKAGWPLMMGAFFTLMDWKQNGRLWKTVLYFAVLLVNIRIIWCITALIGTMLLFAYFLLPFARRWVQKWDFLVFVGIILILFCCLMFFQKYTVSSEPVALIIEEVFKKKRSLSGRLPLWQLGVAIVMKKPWFGVGAQLNPGFILMADEYDVWSWYHAHNEMLQSWYEGGLLMVVLAILMLVYAAWRFRHCEDGKLAGLCKMVLFVFLFMQLSDNMPYYLWYMTAYVAHVGVMLCGLSANKPVPGQGIVEKRETEKDRDLLAEPKAE